MFDTRVPVGVFLFMKVAVSLLPLLAWDKFIKVNNFNLDFSDDVNGLIVLLDVVQVKERHHVQQQEEGGSGVLEKNNLNICFMLL